MLKEWNLYTDEAKSEAINIFVLKEQNANL